MILSKRKTLTWSEVRSQKSEVRSQKSEVRSQKSEVRSQKSEVRSQKSLTLELNKLLTFERNE